MACVLTVAEEFAMAGDDCATLLLVTPSAEKVTLLLLAMGKRYGEGDDWDQLLVQKRGWATNSAAAAERSFWLELGLRGKTTGRRGETPSFFFVRMRWLCTMMFSRVMCSFSMSFSS
ncbi:hypothetical protein POTOM_005804 [Populus tomentosa]|uniref:Uncharacterized protein n=1 Tax=Populus tomentosa TaxID=118781 RepID=A0A8X8AX41_POPTO|nr:hypothetical protein POTOM_005804 [Populus tomentosa]